MSGGRLDICTKKVKATITTTTRLGKAGPNKKRPLKVVLQNPEDRKKILDKAKMLKDTQLSTIYVSKDTHFAIRREQRRLRQKFKIEKEKEENNGKEVVYDNVGRCIKIDGVVIDSFCPVFFEKKE